MSGTIKLFNSDHEIIEERFYYTWVGVKNIAKILMKNNPGKNRYIQIAPRIKITNNDILELNRKIRAAYGNIPVYSYDKK